MNADFQLELRETRTGTDSRKGLSGLKGLVRGKPLNKRARAQGTEWPQRHHILASPPVILISSSRTPQISTHSK